MICCKYFHPFWKEKFYFCDRKCKEHIFHDPVDIFFPELFTVDRKCRYLIFFLDFFCHVFCLCAVRFPGIDQDHERLANAFQLLDRFLFCRPIAVSGKLSDTSVCRHNNPDRGVVMDYLFRPDFCRLCKRNFFFVPRRFHQTFCSIFHVTGGSLHHIAHTINQTHQHTHILCELDFGSFFWHKFRLRCHDALP